MLWLLMLIPAAAITFQVLHLRQWSRWRKKRGW